jgi:hypothetical protein
LDDAVRRVAHRRRGRGVRQSVVHLDSDAGGPAVGDKLVEVGQPGLRSQVATVRTHAQDSEYLPQILQGLVCGRPDGACRVPEGWCQVRWCAW